MASCTAGVSAANTGNNAALTTGSFTPAAGDLLVAIAIVTGQASGGTFTDSQSLGWSKTHQVLKASSADTLVIAVSKAFAANSAMTVTFTPAGSPTATGVAISVIRVSGMTRKGMIAVRQSTTEANHASGTPAPVFSASALTGNPCIAVVANATNPGGLTAPSSWTRQHDTGYATPTTGLDVATIDSGFTGTTVTWGSSSGSAYCDAILELDTSAAPSQYPTAMNVILDATVNVYNTNMVQATGGQSVSSWPDQSNNANEALPNTAPTYNTSPKRITFNGTTQSLINAFAGDPVTGFLVCKTRSTTYAEVLGGKGTAGRNLDAYYIGVNGADVDELVDPYTYKRITSDDPTSGGTVTDGFCYGPRVVVNDTWIILSWRTVTISGAKYIELFINGARIACKLLTGTPISVTAAVIGAGYYSQAITDFADCDVQFVAMSTSELTNTQMDSWHTYLGANYGNTTITLWTAGASVSSRYVFAGFAGDDKSREILQLWGSDDGAALNYINTYDYPASGQRTRDPSIFVLNSNWWRFNTTEDFDGGTATSNSFGVFKSTDSGATWTKKTDVSCTGVAGISHAWAPEPYVESNGATVVVYFTDSSQLCRVVPTDLTEFSTWGAAATTGPAGGTKLDPFQLLVGGTYYRWYAISGLGIGYATSSTENGTYTQVKDGATDWAGWIAQIKTATGSGAITIEGESIVALPTGGHRIYVDAYNGGTRYGLWYSDNATDNFSSAGAWTSMVQVTSPAGSGIGMRHGTMLSNRPPVSKPFVITGLSGAIMAM